MTVVRQKKVKKSIKFPVFAILLFVVSSLFYFGTRIYLRNYNNSLSSQKQAIENQIAALKVENDAIKVTIQDLSARDRVVSIANDAGLSLNQENIVTITTEGE